MQLAEITFLVSKSGCRWRPAGTKACVRWARCTASTHGTQKPPGLAWRRVQHGRQSAGILTGICGDMGYRGVCTGHGGQRGLGGFPNLGYVCGCPNPGYVCGYPTLGYVRVYPNSGCVCGYPALGYVCGFPNPGHSHGSPVTTAHSCLWKVTLQDCALSQESRGPAHVSAAPQQLCAVTRRGGCSPARIPQEHQAPSAGAAQGEPLPVTTRPLRCKACGEAAALTRPLVRTQEFHFLGRFLQIIWSVKEFLTENGQA